MLLDEEKVGTGNVEVVVCSPKTVDLFGGRIVRNSCEKEYIASYEICQ